MDLQDLFGVVVTFVAIGVLLTFGLNVQSSVRDTYKVANCGLNSTGGTGGSITYTACGAEYNASQYAMNANNNISGNLPILGTIVIASIVIGVLVKAFVL